MEFLRYKYNNLYPVFAIFSGLLICIFALVYANHVECLYFLISVYLFSFFFIDYKKCIKVLLFSFVLGAIFFVVAFLVSGVYEQGVFMVNRILAFSIGVLLAMYMRNKSYSKCHWRQVVLFFEAMIIVIVSFIPMNNILNIISNILISFLCAMQAESFRKVLGKPFSSTMCTGNLRSGTEYLYNALASKDYKLLKNMMQ